MVTHMSNIKSEMLRYRAVLCVQQSQITVITNTFTNIYTHLLVRIYNLQV